MKKNLLFATFFYLIIMSLNVEGQTNVSGGIYANTTWTKANSPYIVTDTVVVFPGVTLTIDPGVTVKFKDKMQLEIRQGKLIAIGNIIDSITFTSNSNSPIAGIWGNIYINGGSLISVFEYCNFIFANSALLNHHLNGNQNTTVELQINHSLFFNNVTGITCMGNGGGFTKIDTTELTGNINSTSGAQIIFTGCIIRNNQVGIFIQPYAYTYTYINSSSINSNQFGITGSAATGASQYSIKYSTIDSNSVAGIVLGDYPNLIDTILNCEIKNNPIGVLDSFGNGLLMKQTIIENNNIGLYFRGANNKKISCNKICNNLAFDLYYNSASNTFDASNNYWCTPDSVSTGLVIYDGYDNINLGLVNFMPLDTQSCYLTGCNLGVTATVTNATCDTCHNGSASAHVINGFAPFIYTWYSSPIQITQTATKLASGTYTVCVTDGHGCTTCNPNIFIDSTNCTGFSIKANAKNATCTACADGSAWVSASGGSSPFKYTWYTGPIQTTDSIFNLIQGTYSVCVTDLYGCSACDTVTVGIGNCSAHFNLYPDTAVAHHYWAVNMASGVSPIKYDWNWGDGSPHDTTAFPAHQYAVAGFYNICLSITDSAGCTNTYCSGFYLLRTSPDNNANTMVSVNVVSSLTGIKVVASVNSCFIYPNPSNGTFTFSYHLQSSKAELQLKDATGRVVFKQNILDKTGEEPVNLPGLNNGIYYWELISGDKAPLNGRIVVVH